MGAGSARLLEVDGGQIEERGGHRNEALNVLAHAQVVQLGSEEVPAGLIIDDLAGFLIHGLALLLIILRTAAVQQLVNLLILVEGAVALRTPGRGVEVGVQAVVRVGGNRGPAQQEQRQTLGGLLQIGAPLDNLDVDVDADVLQLRLQNGGELGIDLLVGDVEGGGDAVGVAGLGEQRLGLLNVVLVRDEVLVEAVDVLGQRSQR